MEREICRVFLADVLIELGGATQRRVHSHQWRLARLVVPALLAGLWG